MKYESIGMGLSVNTGPPERDAAVESKYTKPFIDATIKVLETMAFTPPRLVETCLWDQAHAVGEVVGVVGLAGREKNIKGFLSIGFTEASIVQIVSNMFGEEFESMNTEVKEAVGEIANMISGQARQGLSAMGVKLEGGLPSIVSGKKLVMGSSGKKPLIMIKFEVEKGPFEVGVCIDGL